MTPLHKHVIAKSFKSLSDKLEACVYITFDVDLIYTGSGIFHDEGKRYQIYVQLEHEPKTFDEVYDLAIKQAYDDFVAQRDHQKYCLEELDNFIKGL